jgi:hypothetical protein
MSAPLLGTVVGDRFVLEELTGSGGMGEVYRARDRETGERVAVKMLHAGGQSHVDRFLREARVLSQLEHPGIVRYIAHGDSPSLYLAMEWLEGEDLGRTLARAPLGPEDALELTRRVASALDAAHRRGVVHRDIKPSNIFLCNRAIEQVKLLDFGIARLSSGTRAMTLSGQVLGTIGYMAPEQARERRELSPSADVFSLGCVLFECLTGRPAFTGDRLMAVLAKVLFADLPRVSEFCDDVAPALDELVLRMMQKVPEERPTLPVLLAELETIARDRRLYERRPRTRPSEKQRSAPAVTGDEQRLMAVLIAEHGHVSRRGHSSPTLLLEQIDQAEYELVRAVAPFKGRLEMLANGTPLVVLTGSGAATDLAARAARLGLSLRRTLPEPAMALAMGRGDPTAETLIGDVVSRAEHLLGLAKQNEAATGQRAIRIDQTLAGLLDARFAISGDAESLELVAERTEVDPVRKLLGRPAPFLGRDRELAFLTGVLDECLSEPVASAVVVTAPAGWGKSRLANEFVRSMEGRDLAVWRAGADPLARGSSFAMLAALLRGLFGLVEGEPIEVRRQKIEARVARLLPASEIGFVVEFLGEIVGLTIPDEARTASRSGREDLALTGEQMRSAWESLIAAECAGRPLLIILEDLHFGDLPTVRFIDAALRSQRESPFMVLALARPEVHDQFPDLWSERRVQHLRLPELTPRAARRLVLDVLGEGTSEATAEALAKRAGGNTFYLEELIRAVAENRGGALPETVLAMAQARLEQLESDARRILRAASVFGEAFWTGGVATLIGAEREETAAVLDELVRREFVAKVPTSRFRDEDEFVFRHALVREAAYGMLTERDQQQAHRLASAWLEAAGERDAIVMAEHLERGGEPAGAVVWYLWAAEQALEGNDYLTVIERAKRGIACGASGATLGELLLLEAEAMGWGAESRRHADLANDALALLPAGTSSHARAAAELAVASARLGDLDALRRAATSLEEAGAASRALGVALAVAIARTAIELYVVGRSDWADPLVATIEQSAPGFEEDRPILETIRTWLAAARGLFSGCPELYAERGDELVASLEQHGQLRSAVLAEVELVTACAAVGADERAVLAAKRAIERAESTNLTSYAERARAHLALPLARRGDAAGAEGAARAARDAAVAASDRVTEARARASLTAVRWLSGDVEGAEVEARELLSNEAFPAGVRADVSAILERAPERIAHPGLRAAFRALSDSSS